MGAVNLVVEHKPGGGGLYLVGEVVEVVGKVAFLLREAGKCALTVTFKGINGFRQQEQVSVGEVGGARLLFPGGICHLLYAPENKMQCDEPRASA